MWVSFLGGEDALEKEMATHSSILAWKILKTKEQGRLQSTGSWEIWTWGSDWIATINSIVSFLSFLTHGIPVLTWTLPWDGVSAVRRWARATGGYKGPNKMSSYTGLKHSFLWLLTINSYSITWTMKTFTPSIWNIFNNDDWYNVIYFLYCLCLC